MKLRALMSTGLKLMICAGPAGMSAELAGASASWSTLVFLLLFIGGGIDVGIAAWRNAVSAWQGDDEEACAAVEFDETGIHCWFGDRAQENRRRFLERRADRPKASRPLAEGAFRGMSYPAGLSYRAPWAPQKRLVPPLSPSWRDQGIEFPEQPAYSMLDQLCLLQPPFPIHFRTMVKAELVDGVRMLPAQMEAHTYPHEGCPACEAWRRGTGR